MTPDGHTKTLATADADQKDMIAPIAGVLGIVCYCTSSIAILPLQWNVVTYEVTAHSDTPHQWPGLLFGSLLMLAPLGWSAYVTLCSRGAWCVRRVLSFQVPLLLSAPLAVAAWGVGGSIFLWSLLHIVGAGWSVARALTRVRTSNTSDDRLAPASLGRDQKRELAALLSLSALVVLLTLIHTRIQLNFFEHFMLGHADMGHFAEELKNALVGRGLRSDSFPNTRLGWHFTPLLYVLVPGYRLWPSPVFLMMCSALFVHSAALPIYWMGRRTTGSAATAWLFAVAWLLHPSISRLPYSGTYGFQWLYITLPLTIWWMGAGLLGHQRCFYLLLCVLLLCRETTAATTLGFGGALLLFLKQRRDGMATVIISLLYGMICVALIIPFFARSGTYERMEMFGSLGSSFSDLLTAAFRQPGAFWGRFVRSEAIMFLAVLATTLALRPLRFWCISIGAIPALFLILLMENAQWLSIKFWYQVSFLPILFVAAMTDRSEESPEGPTGEGSRRLRPAARKSLPAAASVLLCCAWGHYLFGFSPLARSYDIYAADPRLQTPDPLFQAVSIWRSEIPRTATILATERLAAHFTDYQRIYTGKRPQPADYVVIDPHDAWDTSGLPGRLPAYHDDPAYRVYDTIGAVVVFERAPDRRVPPND